MRATATACQSEISSATTNTSEETNEEYTQIAVENNNDKMQEWVIPNQHLRRDASTKSTMKDAEEGWMRPMKQTRAAKGVMGQVKTLKSKVHNVKKNYWSKEKKRLKINLCTK